MKPRRDIHKRQAYAQRRASLAIDRLIRTCSREERDKASSWAKDWGMRAGLLSQRR